MTKMAWDKELIAAALYWPCRAYPTVRVQVRLTNDGMDDFYHFPRVIRKVVDAQRSYRE